MDGSSRSNEQPAGTPDGRGGADLLTDLIIQVFRLNGALLAAGDALVGGLGLTSARWQVLGAIDGSPVALPVSHIARNMGLTRQAVQRSVDEMRADGLLRLEDNPHHRRAMLVLMTPAGQAAYDRATVFQRSWVRELGAGLPSSQIAAATALLHECRRRLERDAMAHPGPAAHHRTNEGDR